MPSITLPGRDSPNSLIFLVLGTYAIVGITFNFIIADFDSSFNYLGCIASCNNAINPNGTLAIFGNSPWTFLFNGDLLGFINSWGIQFQHQGNIWDTVISFVASAILLILSLGIGVGALTASITVSDETAQLIRSFGFGLLLWGFFASVFGAWTSVIGWGLGIIVNLLLQGIYMWALYWRGQSVV